MTEIWMQLLESTFTGRMETIFSKQNVKKSLTKNVQICKQKSSVDLVLLRQFWVLDLQSPDIKALVMSDCQ